MVYQSLSATERNDYALIKKALTVAFSVDQFQVYELFVTRFLRSQESVDVYLADLKRLLDLVDSSASEDILKCAFVRGLPGSLMSQLVSVCCLNKITLNVIVNRARSLKNSEADGYVCMMNKRKPNNLEEKVCYNCRKPGHLARHCMIKEKNKENNLPRK